MNTKQIIGLILSLFGGGILFWFLVEAQFSNIGPIGWGICIIPLIAGIILIILGGKEKGKR